MFRLSYLTSNKVKVKYLINYAVVRILYILQPILTMFFIDSIVDKNWSECLIWGGINIFLFFISQAGDYFLDVSEGSVISNNFVNIFSRLNKVVCQKDLKAGGIKQENLNQTMGQNYEMVKKYIFIKPSEMIFSIITIVVVISIMFYLAWKVTLVVVIIVPAAMILSINYNGKISRLSSKNLDNMKSVKQYINDQNILTKEDRLLDYKQMNGLNSLFKKYEKNYNKKNKTQSFFLNIISYGALNSSILATILISGYLVYKGEITIGVLYALQSYTSQLWSPAEFLLSFRSDYYSIKPIMFDIYNSLNSKLEKRRNEKVDTLAIKDFISVDQSGKALIDKLNIEFKKGNIYLLTGENGIGKTTLIEAILGYNSRYQGQVLINDRGNNFTKDFVYIPATPYISWFFNQKMQKGSSGQKKMLQISNCMKTKKTVYIIDEPTNYLDREHKIEVVDAIRNLSNKENIVIVVSHDSEIMKLEPITIELMKAK